MNELISIVLPVYNGERFLSDSIESIINQTYPHWELLVLDDCSTDNTPAIVNEYVNKDRRIKYFRNQSNLKLPKNLNIGFSLANGDFLTWTSDDNKFHKQALEKMITSLKGNGIDFAFSSCNVIDENDNILRNTVADDNYQNVLVGYNCIGACFMYTRKVYETIGNYDPEFTLVEDYDYWQRALSKFKAIAIPEILYDYRVHSGALTSTMRQDQFNLTLEKMLLKNVRLFGKLNLQQKYHFYSGLYKCRVNSNDTKNPYKNKFKFYSFMHFLTFRIPQKINRIFKKQKV